MYFYVMTVAYPRGFRASGVAAGIKTGDEKDPIPRDVALVVNDGPRYVAAGVFTSNRIKAAPVRYCLELLNNPSLKAIVLNSGGANACTGPDGYADTVATADHAASVLGINPDEVAICSTGLIGERLPMKPLLAGVESAAADLSRYGGAAAAEAILTTDSHPKTASRDAGSYRIGAMAKGAGMLAPGLATMLVTITTDAQLSPELADAALRHATRQTFDRIDADGCMSTNDAVILLASGASEATPTEKDFTAELTAVCADLAQQLIADAEGATKEIAITVTNAAAEDDAIAVGRSIARNNLVKCALFGNDPNWGRIIAAIGTTDAAFDPEQIDVAINGVWICRNGAANPDADRNLVDLTPRDVAIEVNLHAGHQRATIHTNDLSLGYVHENSAYSS